MLYETEKNMISSCVENAIENNSLAATNFRSRQVLSSSQLCLLAIGLSLLVIVNFSLLLWVWLFIANLHITEPTSSSSSSVASSVPNNDIIGLDSTISVGGDGISVSNIRGSPKLSFSSPAGISIGPSKRSQSSLKADITWLDLINGDRVISWADSIKVVSSSDQRVLMNVNEQIAAFGFEQVTLSSSRRLSLNYSLQTPKIEQAFTSVHLISQNRQIHLRGPKSMRLSAKSDFRQKSYLSKNKEIGSNQQWIELSGTKGVSLSAERVTLSSEDVIFGERLLTVHSSKHGRTYPTVGQLCVCASSGLVFASATQTDCIRSGQVCDQNQ